MELQWCWSGVVERGFLHIRMDTKPVNTLSIPEQDTCLTVTAASTPPATPPATNETHCGV